MRPDYEQELLALELRDGDRLQTAFVVVDGATGQAKAPYRAPENWWIGLEEISWRLLFLHGFGDRKVGAHQGITAVTADTNQVLWQQEQVVFYGLAANESIIAYPDKTEKDFFISLAAQTGALLETGISREQAYAAVADFEKKRTATGYFPVHHPAGSAHFTLLRQFILSRSGREAVGAVDYLETEDYLVVGYYEPTTTGTWQHILGVYALASGALLFEEVLTANGMGLSTQAFLVVKNTLLFIQERNTLVGYSF